MYMMGIIHIFITGVNFDLTLMDGWVHHSTSSYATYV